MRVFKTKEFARFSRREKIRDLGLCEAVERAERGLIDADIGGGVIKQRVARPGEGRSGGYRTIIAYRSQTRSIFMYGFPKSGKANLSDDEVVVYRRLAKAFLGLDEADLLRLTKSGELIEVAYDDA